MEPHSEHRTERALLEVERIKDLVRPVVESESGLLGLYLFGSRASGDMHETSDVDLGALFASSPDVWKLLGLEDRLELAVDSKVDLVDLGKASAFLALDIIRGERIYSSDPVACDLFDLYVMRRAADLAPFERMKRASTMRNPAEGGR